MSILQQRAAINQAHLTALPISPASM